MNPYLLVTGDFVKTGGMDRANHALAKYLAERGGETHLVAYRIADDLAGYPNVFFHRVPKPLNSYFLASPILARAGRKWALRIAARGGRVVVNGGNCVWPDINWAHHLHVSYKPQVTASPLWKLKAELSFRSAAAHGSQGVRRRARGYKQLQSHTGRTDPRPWRIRKTSAHRLSRHRRRSVSPAIAF